MVGYQEKKLLSTISEKKNWSQAQLIILFEFLCYSIHDKIIGVINLSLYLWSNLNLIFKLIPFFIKMNCQKYGKTLPQIEDESEIKSLRKQYPNIKTSNIIQ